MGAARVRQEETSVELDEAGVCADDRDGVLEVHVPKAPERRLRRIDVSSAE